MKQFLHNLSKNGIAFPYAWDASTNKPSVTLFFAYATFVLGYIATIVLMIRDIYLGCTAAIIFWTIATTFYLLRRLSKASFDLDDRSINLESGEDTEKENNEKNTD